ncbi:zinc finger protein [Pseudomassariella vexata]|uniref:Zinc finger protein n=1 Tax=Pseudomassariella vexata TaxID=1141098 RepID=A0A1Y2ED16_9PEZI|nr:zinc finger protein [Pseudomassariella vexata]ORY69473.1 zinc finger protein [Pseudomassariella vexata]
MWYVPFSAPTSQLLPPDSFTSKHILNAQVAIRSPCCKKWFDCAECHHESESHPLLPSIEMTFACKKCRKCFRKDAQEFEEADEYCPHCDNHFVLEAVVPKPALRVEGEDARVDARMLKDERVKPQPGQELRTIFDADKEAGRLG